MKDWFIWKGVRCTSLGIHALSLPDFTIPEERVNFVDAIGESGSFISKEEEFPVFNDHQFSVTCVVDNLNNINRITDYLRGTSKVEFASRPGGYYLATVNNQIPFSKIVRGDNHRQFAVPFRCKPFWYPNDEVCIVKEGNVEGQFTIENPGNVYARPLIRVTPTVAEVYPEVGSGEEISYEVASCTIDINGKSVVLGNMGGEDVVTVDCEMKEAYDDRTSPMVFKNNTISCDQFPWFDIGTNTITISGQADKIEFYPRWRWL